MPSHPELRSVLLQVIADLQPTDPLGATLQSSSVLEEAARRADINRSQDMEQALLTQFHELFRTGYLAWGLNLANPNPPFFHLTDQGSGALERYSRDPGNPAGYLSHLTSTCALDSLSESYLREALDCYNASLVKSAAVMIGGAAESLIINLRDEIERDLLRLSKPVPKKMRDWRSRTVAVALQKFLESKKSTFPRRLREDFEAYWLPFTQQIRVVRNDAGHPASIDPVTPESVHASLLIFPEFAKLQNELLDWVGDDLANAV